MNSGPKVSGKLPAPHQRHRTDRSKPSFDAKVVAEHHNGAPMNDETSDSMSATIADGTVPATSSKTSRRKIPRQARPVTQESASSERAATNTVIKGLRHRPDAMFHNPRARKRAKKDGFTNDEGFDAGENDLAISSTDTGFQPSDDQYGSIGSVAANPSSGSSSGQGVQTAHLPSEAWHGPQHTGICPRCNVKVRSNSECIDFILGHKVMSPADYGLPAHFNATNLTQLYTYDFNLSLERRCMIKVGLESKRLKELRPQLDGSEQHRQGAYMSTYYENVLEGVFELKKHLQRLSNEEAQRLEGIGPPPVFTAAELQVLYSPPFIIDADHSSVVLKCANDECYCQDRFPGRSQARRPQLDGEEMDIEYELAKAMAGARRKEC